ncbi:MAG: hypothetical protein IJT15_04630 [Rickettsiales bacterium]|nr:hypothetical protein [Rickettsiales bacterium]
MWQQGGRKMPILNNHNIGSSMDYQNPNPSLQQLAERNAVGDIKDMTNRQEYLKQIKKNAKTINQSINARIDMAKGSVIGATFNRPLIPPNAHDKIKIKLSKNDIYKHIGRLRQYVDMANQEYENFGLPKIVLPSDEEIQTFINKNNKDSFEFEADYLAICQVMRFILQDSHLANSPEEADFYLKATSAFTNALQEDDKKKMSTTKKIGYVRTAFGIASALVGGVISLGSYLGLFATPTLAILGMSFPIATIVCVGLCTLPFIITMIKNVISQIMDKTNDLDLELVQGTSKDFPVKGIKQALDTISQTKQREKQKEDLLAMNGIATNIKHKIKEKQLAFGNMFLEICKEQNVKPEEMLAKCKDINFVQQNNDNPAVAIIMNAMMQRIDMYEAIVVAKLKQNKQATMIQDLVKNVIYHSEKLKIDPILAVQKAHNFDIGTANYSEGVLYSLSQQAKNHNIDLVREVQQYLNGKNSGNILSNSKSSNTGNKLVNNNYDNNIIASNNNIAKTGIPSNILNNQFLQ